MGGIVDADDDDDDVIPTPRQQQRPQQRKEDSANIIDETAFMMDLLHVNPELQLMLENLENEQLQIDRKYFTPQVAKNKQEIVEEVTESSSVPIDRVDANTQSSISLIAKQIEEAQEDEDIMNAMVNCVISPEGVNDYEFEYEHYTKEQ